jgi:hypothetical protein
MVRREPWGREQVGLEPDVETLVDAAKALDELRLDRRRDHDRHGFHGVFLSVSETVRRR